MIKSKFVSKIKILFYSSDSVAPPLEVKDEDVSGTNSNPVDGEQKSSPVNRTALIIIIVMSVLTAILIISALVFYFSRRNYKKVPTTSSEDI